MNTEMISRTLYWRGLQKDRIFILLLALTLATFILSWIERESDIEQTVVPLQLAVTFFVANLVFAFLTLRREPLLAYMFLSAAILTNTTLFFYYRYLLSIQLS